MRTVSHGYEYPIVPINTVKEGPNSTKNSRTQTNTSPGLYEIFPTVTCSTQWFLPFFVLPGWDL